MKINNSGREKYLKDTVQAVPYLNHSEEPNKITGEFSECITSQNFHKVLQ